MKIGIIGAGWYGCHIGLLLKGLGMDVKIFEKDDSIFMGASGLNQYRLHTGFHYARHYETRKQSREGFSLFLERYPELSAPCKAGNIYAVPRYDSLIDFKTYKSIMTATDIDFNEMDVPDWLKNVEGCVLTQERIILTDVANKYFEKKLENELVLNTKITDVRNFESNVELEDDKENIHNFDYVINCTWGHMLTLHSVFFEPSLILYYNLKEKDADFPAVTFVDGDLCSIYPMEQLGLFTLSSVPLTPLLRTEHASEARSFVDNIDTARNIIDKKIPAFEKQITKYLPLFNELFEYAGNQISIKTKPYGLYDNRSVSMRTSGRVLSIMSGKIDTIFQAGDMVLSHIARNSNNE